MEETRSEGHTGSSKLTMLPHAEYACPVCNEVVIRITGNLLEYLPDHVHAGGASGNDGFVPLVMHHPPKATNFVWPIELTVPFLTIRSSEMRS